MSTTLTLTSKHGQPTTASASLALPVDPANTVAVAGQQAKSARVSCKKKKRKLRQLEKDCGVGPDSSLYTRGAWQTPWLDSLGMTEYESMEQRLHDEIVAYVAYCNATEQEVRARVLVVAKLEQFIRRRVSVCDVQLFGSVALDVCLPDSDIDLVIQTPQVYDDKYKTRVLHQLASMFRFSISCREPTVAVGACVPVLQFKTSPPLGSYDIDISINADDGVKAVPVIKEYLANFPILRPLLLVLKGFLRKLDLHSASNGGLGSYGLSCMTICFLKLIIRKRDEKLTTDFMENESLGVLLMDFLQFYGQELDWTTSCISPAQGEIVTKESLGFRNSTLPEALSIQCLLNPGRDIGRSASRAKQIKAAFSDAFNTLKAYKLSMTKCNVLGTIVRFSYLTVDRRERIRHLIDSHELENNLKSLQLPLSWTPPTNPGYALDRRNGQHPTRDASRRGGYPNQLLAPFVGQYPGGYPYYAYPNAGSLPHGLPWIPTTTLVPASAFPSCSQAPSESSQAGPSKRQRIQY